MKDVLFAKDLLDAFRQDKYYGAQKTLANALREFGLSYNEQTENREQMMHTLVVHIMEQRGESEPFLTESFIYAKAVSQLLEEHGLPAPTALQSEPTTQSQGNEALDPAQFEQYFDKLCRNCGTVTDPLGSAYRSPLGRLIFKTYLETLRTKGLKSTARYVLEHLKDFDTEKIINAVQEDYVTWKTEDAKEKLTSLHTISEFILKLDREVEKILKR